MTSESLAQDARVRAKRFLDEAIAHLMNAEYDLLRYATPRERARWKRLERTEENDLRPLPLRRAAYDELRMLRMRITARRDARAAKRAEGVAGERRVWSEHRRWVRRIRALQRAADAVGWKAASFQIRDDGARVTFEAVGDNVRSEQMQFENALRRMLFGRDRVQLRFVVIRRVEAGPDDAARAVQRFEISI